MHISHSEWPIQSARRVGKPSHQDEQLCSIMQGESATVELAESPRQGQDAFLGSVRSCFEVSY